MKTFYSLVLLKNILLCFVFSISLTACASQRSQEVKIPVPVACPAPQIPPKPHLPIADLKLNSPPNVVIKAYAASVRALQDYTNELIGLLKSYQ